MKLRIDILPRLILLSFIIPIPSCSQSEPQLFSGDRAHKDLQYQTELGPRTPGSEAHNQVVNYIVEEMEEAKWEVEIQQTEMGDQPVRNVITKIGQGRPWIILGAHYDSRLFADMDPNIQNQNLPVPGANDGASGVSVLLELGRILPGYFEDAPEISNYRAKQIWLVFFDAEDNGNIPGWDGILGSRAFVNELEGQPDAVVIVDMIGDKNLNIYMEKSSDQNLSEEIWSVASDLGYSTYFIPLQKYGILDDHIPFIEAGITAIDIIDFDYEYWHTIEDTLDKTSAQSLQVVGDTLLAWILDKSAIESR